MNYITDWNFQDSATTTGDGSYFYPNHCDSLTVEIWGTATSSTIIFEGTITSDPNSDSPRWYPILGVKQSDLTTLASQTTGKNEAWIFDCTPYKAIRTRISAISGGNISCCGKAVNTSA